MERSDEREGVAAACARDGLELFELEQVSANRFVGPAARNPVDRVFGGQVVAQALVAASLLEEQGRHAHSLHAYFVRPARRGLPIQYDVTPLLDGRSFASRRVVATQDNETVLALAASFHRREASDGHQAEMPSAPTPDACVERLTVWRAARSAKGLTDGAAHFDGRPVEIVPLDPELAFEETRAPGRASSWIRCRHPVADGSHLHRALLAYASDMMLLRCAMLPLGARPGLPNVQSTSLDHALWIHEEPDLRDWILFDCRSDWAGGARGLTQARFFSRDGRLIGQVAQESLMRVTGTPAPDRLGGEADGGL